MDKIYIETKKTCGSFHFQKSVYLILNSPLCLQVLISWNRGHSLSPRTHPWVFYIVGTLWICRKIQNLKTILREGWTPLDILWNGPCRNLIPGSSHLRSFFHCRRKKFGGVAWQMLPISMPSVSGLCWKPFPLPLLIWDWWWCGLAETACLKESLTPIFTSSEET